MNRQEIMNIIITSLADYLESRGESIKINEQTNLIGKGSVIDSMGLVNIIVDIEGKLHDESIEIMLLSEKAMSQVNSPFRSIESLTNFIESEISGKS